MGNLILDRFLENIIPVSCFEGSGLKDIFQEYANLDVKCRSSVCYRGRNTIPHN